MTECVEQEHPSHSCLRQHAYAMVSGISHHIAFGMCDVGCNGIPHDLFGHVVCFSDHVVCFFNKTEIIKIMA